MNSSFRKQLTWIHTWSGLIFGLVIVMLGVTGAGLVLRPELNRVVNSDLLKVPACLTPLPLDTLAARAVGAHPGKPRAIEVSLDPTDSIAIQFTNKDYVYMAPCSGEVLGTQNQYSGFFGTLDWLHRFMFTGSPTGRPIAGWISLIFTVFLIVGGIALWWPRPGTSLKAAAKFDNKLPGVARTLNLHKIVGLYTSILLLVITVTAVPISFLPVKNLIYRMTGYVEAPLPDSTFTPGAARLSMQAAMHEARAAYPALTWAALTYPPEPTSPIRIEILERNAPHANAKSYLYLDQYSGLVLQTLHYATDINIGRKIYLYCIALHSALVGGLPYQLLLLLACLGIPVQAYSGFSPWIRRKLTPRTRPLLSVRVASKTTVARDIVSLELVHPKGRRLPQFSAGAHIDVHLENGLTRQYSLCGDPRDNSKYTIGVLKVAGSRGGSTAVHNQLNPGDLVTISEPRNFFALAKSAPVSLLIAGGIGITPLLAMAEQLATATANFHLHYCVHSLARAAFLDRIQHSGWAHCVTVHISDTHGRVNLESLMDECDPGCHIYICGPNSFTDACIQAAKSKGIAEAQIHSEHFSAAPRDISSNTGFDVKIASTGKIIHIPQNKTVTEVLAGCGIMIPTSCEDGVCGTCLTGVIDGEVEHNDVILDEADRINNTRFTPCCSRARGSMLVLDL